MTGEPVHDPEPDVQQAVRAGVEAGLLGHAGRSAAMRCCIRRATTISARQPDAAHRAGSDAATAVTTQHVAACSSRLRAKRDAMLAALEAFMPACRVVMDRPARGAVCLAHAAGWTMDTSRIVRCSSECIEAGVMYVPGDYCMQRGCDRGGCRQTSCGSASGRSCRARSSRESSGWRGYVRACLVHGSARGDEVTG